MGEQYCVNYIKDIDNFVWKMCVSNRKLNAITKPFEFQIPRCDDAITIIDTGLQYLLIISLNARQGYHQVTVRKIDREKLAFFSPEGDTIRSNKCSCILFRHDEEHER